MFTLIEWTVCFCTIFILWWKFGWKAIRTMQKLEDVLFANPIPSVKTTEYTGTSTTNKDDWNNSDFITLPWIRNTFSPKVLATSTESDLTNNTNKKEPFHDALASINNAWYQKHKRLVGPTSKTCCSACKQHEVKASYLKNKEDLIDSLHCETHQAHNPWYIRRFASIVHYWRMWYLAYQYHMVSLKDMMNDERVNAAILEVAQKECEQNPNAESLEVEICKQKTRAERITINLRAIQDMKYFRYFSRFAIWFISKVLSRIYPKILVRQSQLESLREARASGYRLIYLPIHRSHIDYVLISWILSSNSIRSPLVAAGDNLNIPIFNKMMRSVGGFFIKRQLDQKDTLYRAILHSYMERTILDDNDLEFFIEGGRTRSGKPGLPKGGLLNIAMDTLFSGQVDDMLIVPVNFSYEKLIEGNYIREQLGKPKVNESFATAVLGLWNSCQTKFGNARIDFGQPFSVKEFMESYQAWNSPTNILRNPIREEDIDNNNNKNKNKANRDINIYREGRACHSDSFALVGSSANDKTIIEDRRNFINCLAQHVIYDGLKCFSLMSTNVIAFLLLNKYRDGVSIEKLIEEMQELKTELIERKHDVNLDGDLKEIIEHALNILGPTLVSQDIVPIKKTDSDTEEYEVILKPNTSLPNIIDLAYYSTCVTPIYALESVIATSLLVSTKSDWMSKDKSTQRILVQMSDIISTCMEICEILEYEFIFHPPCQTLEYAIRNSLESFENQDLIRVIRTQNQTGGDISENSTNSDVIIVIQSEENCKRLLFLNGISKSILDTYAVSSLVLKRLIGHEAKEKQLQMEMLGEVKHHLQLKMISRGESLALDPIRNFIKVLLEWQVLETSTKDKVVTYSLQEVFDNEPGVYDIIRRVQKFQV